MAHTATLVLVLLVSINFRIQPNSDDTLASFLAPDAGIGRLSPATVQCIIDFW